MNTEGKSEKSAHVSVDVSVRRIARVYAEALLNAAEKSGQTEQVLEELHSLVGDVFDVDPRLEILLSSAAMGRKGRDEAIQKVFGDRASPLFFNFLQILNEHERLELIRPVLAEAEALNLERHNQVKVFVQTAVPLPDDLRQSLLERLRVNMKSEPILEVRVVPELIGGMKFRIRDLQVDATISSYLDNLKTYFLSRSSHAIQSRRDRFSSADGN